MKIIPFDIEKAKSGKYKIQTRDGKSVRMICWDKKDSTYNLVALVTFDDGNEDAIPFTKTGALFKSSSSPLDLVLVDESTPNIGKRIYDTIIKTCNKYPHLEHITPFSAAILSDFIQKELNLPKWKRIHTGERLPERSFVKTDSNPSFYIPNEKGVVVCCDCWYLPVTVLDELENENKKE